MKIIYGDLFDQKLLAEADAICITTNGVIRADGRAVMGAGVAKIAAQTWSWVQTRLAELLRNNGNITQIIGNDTSGGLHRRGAFVVAFPTKNHWKDPSDLKLIEKSAKELRTLMDDYGWDNVIISPPGCGNGGLNWGNVAPVLVKYFGNDDRLTVVFKK